MVICTEDYILTLISLRTISDVSYLTLSNICRWRTSVAVTF